MAASLDGLRVLVVEDDALVAMDLEAILSDAGCTVVGPAARLSDALLLAEKELFDGALLDVHLRGEPVYELADALMRRRIPFLFLSGYSQRDLPDRFRASAHCRKPYSPGALLSRLGKVLLH